MEYLSDKSSVARMDKNLEKISPFELKNRLIEMADESVKKMAHVMLNAGRGNPNWIATEAREAFFALGGFGIEECRRVMDMPEGIAGIPQKTGIAQRFEEYLKKHEGNAGTDLLKRTYNYMLMEHAADPDELVHEWTESIVGDQYPMPDRILKYTEILVQDYLNQEMCNGQPPQGKFDLFATEGGTAGMCYVFDSLEENFLLHKGDSIALMVPIFTPYIEIPELTRYDYDVLNIPASTLNEEGLHTWQYKVEDINKLRDTKYKALFIPLIVVNCILLGRAEAFAAKNGPVPSFFDGLGMGLGFTLALTILGGVREFLGTGKLFDIAIMPEQYGMLIFVLAPGAFIALGYLIAIVNKLKKA